MSSPLPYYLMTLEAVFSERKNQDKDYSLRLFAKDLDIDPGDLSKILSGKRCPSVNLGIRILAKLELSDNLRNEFLLSMFERKNQIRLDKLKSSLSSSSQP